MFLCHFIRNLRKDDFIVLNKNKKYLCILLVIFISIISIGCSRTENKTTNKNAVKQKITSNNNSSGNSTTINTTASSNSSETQIGDNTKSAASNQIPIKNNQAENQTIAKSNQIENQTTVKNNESVNSSSGIATPATQSENVNQAKAAEPTTKIDQPTTAASNSQQQTMQTFVGFLQDEDCFVQYVNPQTGVAKEDPGDDSKTCLLMQSCAGSGYGITVKQADGTFKYYYFDGNFATGKKTTFAAGTGAQKTSWDICNNTKKQDHVTVTVTGTLSGTTRTNTNVTFPENKDGINYPLITVNSITEN